MCAESILIEFTACFTNQNSITDISILIVKSLLWTKLRDIVVFLMGGGNLFFWKTISNSSWYYEKEKGFS